MSLFTDIINERREAVLQALLHEQTVESDISFLPTEMGTVTHLFKRLGKKKYIWGLEILEDDNGYMVSIEDQGSIHVPKEHWESFIGETKHSVNKTMGFLDLSIFLKESTEEELRDLRKLLEPSLFALYRLPECKRAELSFKNWQETFGSPSYTSPDSVLISYPAKEGAIRELAKKLIQRAGEDRGGMEMVLDAIKNHEPLNALPVFSMYEWLYGAQATSRYRSIKLVLDAGISLSFQTIQSIRINDSEVVDDFVEADTSVKSSKNVVYARAKSGVFNPHSFRILKNVIDEREEEVKPEVPEDQGEDTDEEID